MKSRGGASVLMAVAAGILLILGTMVTVLYSGSSRMLSERFRVVLQDDDDNGRTERYELRDGEVTLLDVADLDQDGKLDEWVYYQSGKPVVIIRDLNHDGRPDWWEIRKGEKGILAEDRDFDGVVDVQQEVTYDELYR